MEAWKLGIMGAHLEEVPMTPFQETLDRYAADLIAFIPNIVAALLIVLATLILSRWLSRAIVRAARQRAADREVQVLLDRLARWGILILGVIFALDQINLRVTSLLAGLGIAGFTIGFALQDVAKNFVAGALLLLQQPFEIDDLIEVAGFHGRVRDITIRTTEMQAIDGRYVVIPNGDVFTSAIINYTRSTQRRVEFVAGIDYAQDLERVTDVALRSLEKVPGLMEDPAPDIAYTRLGDNAVEVSVLYWVDTTRADYRRAQDVGVQALKNAFQQEGIEMGVPKTSVLLEQAT